MARRAPTALLTVAGLLLLSAPAAFAEDPLAAPAEAVGELTAADGDPEAGASERRASGAAAPRKGSKEPRAKKPARAVLNLEVDGVKRKRAKFGHSVKLQGTLRDYVRGERVIVKLYRDKKVVKQRVRRVRRARHGKVGAFAMKAPMIRPGKYAFAVRHPRTRKQQRAVETTKRFKIKYPRLSEGDKGREVKLLNRLLDKLAFVTGKGKRFGGSTARAVLAYRKANKMKRVTHATPRIVKGLANRRGKVKLKHPGAGKHVEADISRQILILANNGKPKEIYHTSSGAPATPTVLGKYRFYRYQPGFNNVGMYYSVYFIRGYAIHGYKSVPTYPASHGCLRLPMSDAKHIYDWVSLGMPIFTYR